MQAILDIQGFQKIIEIPENRIQPIISYPLYKIPKLFIKAEDLLNEPGFHCINFYLKQRAGNFLLYEYRG